MYVLSMCALCLGLANVCGSFVQSYPVTGSFSRFVKKIVPLTHPSVSPLVYQLMLPYTFLIINSMSACGIWYLCQPLAYRSTFFRN